MNPPLAIFWLPRRFLQLAVLPQPLQQQQAEPPADDDRGNICLLQGLIKNPTAFFTDSNVKTTKYVNVDLIMTNLLKCFLV
mmetsp:Transcript_2238/g.3416  ORF Transcript_2238/g.3416 Transcript_2238/m.3416 type:complete len:81 (+) Transcript_2238:899-1141(+)